MVLKFIFGALALVSLCVQSNADCGYASCPTPKPGMLNVHLIAHTHDDVGWLKSFEEYYYGTRQNIQNANVKLILDSVVKELLNDPSKRFSYAESSFFFKWWEEQTPTVQSQVQGLVQEGRLEFVGGGWSMNDEADVNYQSTIDNLSWGLINLYETFGTCGRPRVMWQIDPFGHSREFGAITAQMGYDGLILGRVDYEDKLNRFRNKSAEMVWRTSDTMGNQGDLFTAITYNGYYPPAGFCFDILCSDSSIVENNRSSMYNLPSKLSAFTSYVRTQSQNYASNNILVTMGGDFFYMDATAYMGNLDILISRMNELQSNGSNINVFYSTPSCYIKALCDANIEWPAKNDGDFFPYGSDSHSYWTGYFISRPSQKRFERVANNFLQIHKQIAALVFNGSSPYIESLNELRSAMGLMQHHDAITGTEKQAVANDFNEMLYSALKSCEPIVVDAFNQLVVDPDNTTRNRSDNFDPEQRFEFSTCYNLNISECQQSESLDRFILTVCNPLAWPASRYIRVPVQNGTWTITDHIKTPIYCQKVPVPVAVVELSYRDSIATQELVFKAEDVPPFGFRSYYIEKVDPANVSFSLTCDESLTNVYDGMNGSKVIGNSMVNVTIGENGFLTLVQGNGVSVEVNQTFWLYYPVVGNNFSPQTRSSGAYAFRPNSSDALQLADRAEIKIINGHVCEEVHQTFNEYISQVIRIYNDENIVELEWMVGPIPIGDRTGREIITRYETDIKSGDEFYTDSNGRQVIKRRLKTPNTYNGSLQEPVSENYYPVTSRMYIRDDTRRFSVLVDRAEGGTSLSEGEIELMVHRRLLRDDGFGVNEALNETEYGNGLIARGKHWLVFGPNTTDVSPSTAGMERYFQLVKLMPGLQFVSDPGALNFTDWMDSYNNNFTALANPLPPNCHILTYEPWVNGSSLVRFEHYLAPGEDPLYSISASFDIRTIFKIEILSIQEMTLAGNQPLNESTRLPFAYVGETDMNEPTQTGGYIIELQPMQIRTYMITVKPQ